MRMKRWIWGSVSALTALAVAAVIALQVSPRPGALLIALWFDHGAAAASRALEKHVPPGIESILDQSYDAASPALKVDIHRPAQDTGALPTIVWIHGGAWISGDKQDVANYLKILAGHGFTAVSVGYALAPRSTYPTQIKQVNHALAYVMLNAAQWRIDPQRIFLAGDSAGAQLAAQLANIIAVPNYARAVGVTAPVEARQVRGVLLFCGAYDFGAINLSGPFGPFLRTVVWSLFGQKNVEGLPAMAQASVLHHVTGAFPPAFITAGNADPLLAQSVAMANKLKTVGVPVDSLFFARDHMPELGHEYQFNLDGNGGRRALHHTLEFLRKNMR
jgi:acetyl esterase